MAVADFTSPHRQPSQPNPVPDYKPGACNIGPVEIGRRRRLGHLGLVVTAATLAALVLGHAPPLVRFLVFLPAAGTAVAYLEAALRFCVAFGSRGVFNFGALGSFAQVMDPRARARDRARALQIIVAGALIGVAVGVAAAALPI